MEEKGGEEREWYKRECNVPYSVYHKYTISSCCYRIIIIKTSCRCSDTSARTIMGHKPYEH